MKKALLLVLVLAFALVPVFSSVASAEAVKAADFTIGAGYNVDGTFVPATLTDTADGVVFEQSKGYFGPGFDAMGVGTAFGDGMEGKFGAYLTEGFDPMDADEISATYSLDEFASLVTNNSTGAVEEGNGWFKFTITGTPGTIDFTDADADGTVDMRGLCVSVAQLYYSWGTEYVRTRVWLDGVDCWDDWGPHYAWKDAIPGAVDAIFEGDNLGKDLTVTLVYRPLQDKYLVKVKMGDDEQILHAGLNLTSGDLAMFGKGAEKFYLGFASAIDTDRKAVQPAPVVYDKDTDVQAWCDYPATDDPVGSNTGWRQLTDAEIAALDDAADFVKEDGKYVKKLKTGINEATGEDWAETDANCWAAIRKVLHKKAGEQVIDENWTKEWSKTEKAYTVPATNVKATIKDIYVGEARQQDAPVIIVTAEPTETPVVPQAGQDFSLAIILGSMAGMLALAGAAVLVNKSRKNA